jgi:nucleotide-binding universal stress UspA family protein
VQGRTTASIVEPFRIAKILFPIDFSNRSSQTVVAGLLLARRFHSEVTLAHVRRRRPTGGPGAISISENPRLCSDADPVRFSVAQAELRAFSSAPIQQLKWKAIVMEHDDVGSAIAELARSTHTDLIAMSTYGTAPFRKLSIGSVTEKVLEEADATVWTNPHGQARVAGGLSKIRRIICAIDRNSRARLVLRWVRDFTRAFGADLTFVHAISTW